MAKFTRKYRIGVSFSNISDLRPETLLKKRLQYRCFPVNFAKLLRTPVFIEHLQANFSVDLKKNELINKTWRVDLNCFKLILKDGWNLVGPDPRAQHYFRRCAYKQGNFKHPLCDRAFRSTIVSIFLTTS